MAFKIKNPLPTAALLVSMGFNALAQQLPIVPGPGQFNGPKTPNPAIPQKTKKPVVAPVLNARQQKLLAGQNASHDSAAAKNIKARNAQAQTASGQVLVGVTKKQKDKLDSTDKAWDKGFKGENKYAWEVYELDYLHVLGQGALDALGVRLNYNFGMGYIFYTDEALNRANRDYWSGHLANMLHFGVGYDVVTNGKQEFSQSGTFDNPLFGPTAYSTSFAYYPAAPHLEMGLGWNISLDKRDRKILRPYANLGGQFGTPGVAIVNYPLSVYNEVGANLKWVWGNGDGTEFGGTEIGGIIGIGFRNETLSGTRTIFNNGIIQPNTPTIVEKVTMPFNSVHIHAGIYIGEVNRGKRRERERRKAERNAARWSGVDSLTVDAVLPPLTSVTPIDLQRRPLFNGNKTDIITPPPVIGVSFGMDQDIAAPTIGIINGGAMASLQTDNGVQILSFQSAGKDSALVVPVTYDAFGLKIS